jgi:hypothetical protein
MSVEKLPQRRWLVTVTQTIEVNARTAEHAEYLGEELIENYGGDTSDVQVEQLPDGDPVD